MKEEWRKCPYAEMDYEVSSLGRIRRSSAANGTKKGLILKQSVAGNGYLYACITINGKQVSKRVNRLVCIAFHGQPADDRAEAAHQDDDKMNNESSNLAWETRKKNCSDAVSRNRYHQGSRHRSAKLHELDIPAIRAALEMKIKPSLIADFYELNVASINDIRANRTWRTV